MSVKVEEEWRFKKIKSETASKSAFSYKINKKLKEGAKFSYGHGVGGVLSREVIVKITGGARNKQGIRGAVEYISKDWQENLIDSSGIRYKTKEEMEGIVKILQENVIQNAMFTSAKEVKLTHNITFSAPRIAEVSKEDALEAARKALSKKYPDNYFVMTYHADTKNPHVHAVLNIHKDNGERIDIRKKDLRDIREGFCQNLIEYGYDVKATRKYGFKNKKYEELMSSENRNIYEVVDFGSASYQLNKRNSKNNYLIYRTMNKGEEVKIWGKEIIEEVTRDNIKIGDLVKINKVGETKIKVPVYGKDGKTIEHWKDAKRNQWSIEKTTDNLVKIERKQFKGIVLDTPQQAAKHLEQKQRFEHEKKLYLNSSYKEKHELEQKMQRKKKYNL
jgi:hypothetical protein